MFVLSTGPQFESSFVVSKWYCHVTVLTSSTLLIHSRISLRHTRPINFRKRGSLYLLLDKWNPFVEGVSVKCKLRYYPLMTCSMFTRCSQKYLKYCQILIKFTRNILIDVHFVINDFHYDCILPFYSFTLLSTLTVTC